MIMETEYVKVSVKADSDTLILLRKHSETIGKSQSHIVRLAVMVFLQNWPKPEVVKEYLEKYVDRYRWQATFKVTNDLLGAMDNYVQQSNGLLNRSDVLRYALHTYLRM